MIRTELFPLDNNIVRHWKTRNTIFLHYAIVTSNRRPSRKKFEPEEEDCITLVL